MSAITNLKKIEISEQLIKNILLAMYLCIPFIKIALSHILLIKGIEDYALFLTLFFIYGLYIILCIEKRELLVPDFWVIYFIVILFFGLTYMFHPEYEHWYVREDYGVLNYVLRPDNGIFIYLFIRLVNNPEQILKTLKFSAWPMYLLYGRMIQLALIRGYWVDLSNHGYESQMSYNLSLGYSVLIFVLPFLYSALEEKKLVDWVGFIVGIVIILVGGSRGPVFDIGIFVFLYILVNISKSKKKFLLMTGAFLFIFLLWVVYPYLLLFSLSVFERFNLSSRFLTMLASSSITEDSGRFLIWSAALKMIQDNPFGYGAMGTRHVISSYIYVGHPHQFFLEILVDFGVFIGTLIIFFLLFSSVKLFLMDNNDEWKGVFLIFFARACQLLLSLTFWHSIGLWGALAVGICIMQQSKMKGTQCQTGQVM